MKKFIMGLLIGSISMLSVGVMANTSSNIQVPAWLTGNVQFIFNGEYKSVPDEYGVLIYNDRTYLPTRFVAENLEAEIDWDDETRTVRISSKSYPKPPEEVEEPAEQKPQEPEPDEQQQEDGKEENEESNQPSGDYRKLPLSKHYDDLEFTATLLNLSDDFSNTDTEANTHTRLYIRIENKESTPLQLLQSKTKMIVDGKEYPLEDMPFFRLDTKWFNDIRQDDELEGYIALPLIPEDSKEMKLTLYILENDRGQTEREIELDIAVELNE